MDWQLSFPHNPSMSLEWEIIHTKLQHVQLEPQKQFTELGNSWFSTLVLVEKSRRIPKEHFKVFTLLINKMCEGEEWRIIFKPKKALLINFIPVKGFSLRPEKGGSLVGPHSPTVLQLCHFLDIYQGLLIWDLFSGKNRIYAHSRALWWEQFCSFRTQMVMNLRDLFRSFLKNTFRKVLT